MIPQKRLGQTDLLISKLVFGTLTISPMQKAFSPEEGAELLVYAFDQSINLFDTAELYDTYGPLRLALRKRPGMHIATKSYAYNKQMAEKAFDDARRALDKDVIEIFLLHEQESIHTMRGHREAFDFFLEQKAKNKIKAVGMSTHRVQVMQNAIKYPGIDVMHPLLNIKGLGIGDGTRQDMEAACASAHKSGIGIYAMKALGGGHLIKNIKNAIEYINGLAYIDGVALGMQSIAEIDVNVSLFSGREPQDDQYAMATNKKRELIIQDWCTGCGACARRCGQQALSIKNNRAQVNLDKCVLCGYCAAACPEFCIKVI